MSNPAAPDNLERGDTVTSLVDVTYGNRVVIRTGVKCTIKFLHACTAQIVPEGKTRPVEVQRNTLKKI